MMGNKKGFLIVELVISFAFVIIVVMITLQAAFTIRDRQYEAMLNTHVTTFKMNLFEMLQDDLENLNTVTVNSNGAVINGQSLTFVTGAGSNYNTVTFRGNRLVLTREPSAVLHISSVNCTTNSVSSSFTCIISFGGISAWNDLIISAYISS